MSRPSPGSAMRRTRPQSSDDQSWAATRQIFGPITRLPTAQPYAGWVTLRGRGLPDPDHGAHRSGGDGRDPRRQCTPLPRHEPQRQPRGGRHVQLLEPGPGLQHRWTRQVAYLARHPARGPQVCGARPDQGLREVHRREQQRPGGQEHRRQHHRAQLRLAQRSQVLAAEAGVQRRRPAARDRGGREHAGRGGPIAEQSRLRDRTAAQRDQQPAPDHDLHRARWRHLRRAPRSTAPTSRPVATATRP